MKAVLLITLLAMLMLFEPPALARQSALITVRAATYRVTGHVSKPGDQQFYTVLLYNFRITRNAIGNGTLICTYVGRGGPLGSGTSECFGTYVLPKGKITVHGSRKTPTYFLMAVTGGSGFYSGARGQLITSTRGLPIGQQRLVFSLE